MTNITGGGINNSTETVADFEKCGIWSGQLHFYWAQHSSGSVVTSTVPDCFPCLPSAERTTLLIKSSLLWEPLAALFFWDSEKTQQKKLLNFFFVIFCLFHFLHGSMSSYAGLTWVQQPGFAGHLLPQRADVPHPDGSLVCRVARRDLHLVVFFERALPLRHDLQPAGLR